MDEQELAAKLVTSGTQQQSQLPQTDHPTEEAQQTMQAMKERLEHEASERQRLQEQLEQEKAQREELQRALDEASAAASASKEKKKKKKAAATEPAEGEGNPADWKRHTSKSGKPYWYNKKTKKSSWKDPTA